MRTKDAANIGRTEYVVDIGDFPPDAHYPRNGLHTATFATFREAQAWAEKMVPADLVESEGRSASVRRQTWERYVFDDDDYGRVIDADAVEDGSFGAFYDGQWDIEGDV